jgi:hypothetical protein
MNERYKLSIAITLNKINEGIVNRDKYDITLVLNGTTKFSAVIFKKKKYTYSIYEMNDHYLDPHIIQLTDKYTQIQLWSLK